MSAGALVLVSRGALGSVCWGTSSSVSWGTSLRTGVCWDTSLVLPFKMILVEADGVDIGIPPYVDDSPFPELVKGLDNATAG